MISHEDIPGFMLAMRMPFEVAEACLLASLTRPSEISSPTFARSRTEGIGADQPLNADRCESLGVARVLDAMTLTPESLRMALSQVLDESSYRHHAQRLRDEIAALPEPASAVGLLEQIAESGRPR